MELMGETAESKIKYLIDLLNRKGRGYYLQNRYRGGHTILRSDIAPSLYCVFKREYYLTFGKEFPEYTDELGESINLEALERAIALKCDYIVFIHSVRTFKVFPMQIKKFCEARNLIRQQKRFNQYKTTDCTNRIQLELESTYSFPITLMEEVITTEDLN